MILPCLWSSLKTNHKRADLGVALCFCTLCHLFKVLCTWYFIFYCFFFFFWGGWETKTAVFVDIVQWTQWVVFPVVNEGNLRAHFFPCNDFVNCAPSTSEKPFSHWSYWCWIFYSWWCPCMKICKQTKRFCQYANYRNGHPVSKELLKEMLAEWHGEIWHRCQRNFW